MERYLKLKQGLEEINTLNQDLSSHYDDQQKITLKLEKHVVEREKLFEEMPSKPDYDKYKSTSLEVDGKRGFIDSLLSHKEVTDNHDPSSDSWTIAEILLLLSGGLFLLVMLVNFLVYGIPTMELVITDSLPDSDYWTFGDLLFYIITLLTIIGYIVARRSMTQVVKRGVSLLELPGVAMIWLGFICIWVGVTEGTVSFLFVGVIFGVVALLPGFGSFYAVKVSQRRKYEYLNLSRDVRIYEEVTSKLDGLNKAIERETKKLNEKLEEIAKTDSRVSDIWSSVESMVPKSEMQPTNA